VDLDEVAFAFPAACFRLDFSTVSSVAACFFFLLRSRRKPLATVDGHVTINECEARWGEIERGRGGERLLRPFFLVVGAH
jgi:hypothetical protein